MKKEAPQAQAPAPPEDLHSNGHTMAFMKTVPEGTYIFPKDFYLPRHDENGRRLTKEQREQMLCEY